MAIRDGQWVSRRDGLACPPVEEDALVCELHLAALSRPAPGAGAELGVEPPCGAGNRTLAVEDLFRALLNSQEFLFHH
jgi:hypothetical protein